MGKLLKNGGGSSVQGSTSTMQTVQPVSTMGSTNTLQTSLPFASEAERLIAFAKHGTPLLKIRSRLSRNTRHFYVDEEGLLLKYRGSKKIKRVRKFLGKNAQDMSSIFLSDIKEVREGPLSDRFDIVYKRTELPRLQDRCFVILVGERYDTLDLIARTPDERRLWIEALNQLKADLEHHEEFNPIAVRNAYLRLAFERADRNKNGTLELKEVMKILNEANAAVDETYAKELLIKAKMKIAAAKGEPTENGTDNNNMFFKQQLSINMEEYIAFAEDLIKRKDLDALFRNYDNGKGYMTAEEVLKFFRDNHDNKVTIKECQEVMQKCEAVPELKSQCFLSKEGFDIMFNTALLDIRKQECNKVYQDMTRPLCDYYVDSSHNTYIQSNQLTGDSRVESYVIALRSGCRCVECEPPHQHNHQSIHVPQPAGPLEKGLSAKSKNAPKTKPTRKSTNKPPKMPTEPELKWLLGEGLEVSSRNSLKTKQIQEQSNKPPELDVWDGDTEPEIFHGLGGFTMTSKILFRDVIEVVDKFAFETSEYPVILSIENHCSVEQQTMMARFMRSMLGEKLLTEQLPDDCKELPSPEQLKFKVIVKAKKISDPTELNFDIEELCDNMEETAVGEDSSDEAKEAKKKALDEYVKKESSKTHELSQELSDCIVICRATSFKSFEESAKSSFANMSSFSESKALKLMDKNFEGFIRHNQRQFSRIYPAGSRTGSSNYDPLPMWLAGCQLVALNIQTPDVPMHVNKGLFEDNGRCGYVKKPDFLTSETLPCKPLGPYPEDWKKILNIKIIGGYHLPKKEGDKVKNILDPYIKVNVMGVPDDQKAFQTKVVEDNGLNPEWNEEFTFTINCPSYAFLYFQVYDSSNTSTDEVVAQYCLPFSCVRNGYRMVNLKSPTGETGISQLLVHVKIT